VQHAMCGRMLGAQVDHQFSLFRRAYFFDHYFRQKIVKK
jgi:hypothetical protein